VIVHKEFHMIETSFYILQINRLINIFYIRGYDLYSRGCKMLDCTGPDSVHKQNLAILKHIEHGTVPLFASDPNPCLLLSIGIRMIFRFRTNKMSFFLLFLY
jgi:hypothetical protein